jgi:hypothetical protein
MSSPASWFVIGVVVGVLATLLVMRLLRSTLSETGRPAQAPIPPIASVPSDDSEIADLRQTLRVMTLHDEAKIDRLIEAERERTPGASLVQLMRSAIERSRRHNR